MSRSDATGSASAKVRLPPRPDQSRVASVLSLDRAEAVLNRCLGPGRQTPVRGHFLGSSPNNTHPRSQHYDNFVAGPENKETGNISPARG